MLEDEADAPLAHRPRQQILVAEAHGAGVGKLEAGDHAQQSRLAGAGGSQQRQKLAILGE